MHFSGALLSLFAKMDDSRGGSGLQFLKHTYTLDNTFQARGNRLDSTVPPSPVFNMRLLSCQPLG